MRHNSPLQYNADERLAALRVNRIARLHRTGFGELVCAYARREFEARDCHIDLILQDQRWFSELPLGEALYEPGRRFLTTMLARAPVVDQQVRLHGPAAQRQALMHAEGHLAPDTESAPFYAGAAIRTRDGFLVGVLSITADRLRPAPGPRVLMLLESLAALLGRWLDGVRHNVYMNMATGLPDGERFVENLCALRIVLEPEWQRWSIVVLEVCNGEDSGGVPRGLQTCIGQRLAHIVPRGAEAYVLNESHFALIVDAASGSGTTVEECVHTILDSFAAPFFVGHEVIAAQLSIRVVPVTLDACLTGLPYFVQPPRHLPAEARDEDEVSDEDYFAFMATVRDNVELGRQEADETFSEPMPESLPPYVKHDLDLQENSWCAGMMQGSSAFAHRAPDLRVAGGLTASLPSELQAMAAGHELAPLALADIALPFGRPALPPEAARQGAFGLRTVMSRQLGSGIALALEGDPVFSISGIEFDTEQLLELAQDPLRPEFSARLLNWYLEDALPALREAASGSPGVRLMCRMSPIVLCEKDFSVRLADALQRHAIDPGTIDLVFDEKVLLEMVPMISADLSGIRTLGCGVVIDNFGMVGMTLEWLPLFPVSAIRLNDCFLDRIAGDQDFRDSALVFVTIAQASGLMLQARCGIGAATRAILEELGCAHVVETGC